ncbi:glycine betaine ABC transporter substrate-binding protein [Candidatus Poriferisodalis sp.]|uniref:glycine betaine ABC transporter substrate-binding protein n=1 Tax=Candidatus Poriferisodalis sp. TaxID=3101277 RepID=UPI003AF4495C
MAVWAVWLAAAGCSSSEIPAVGSSAAPTAVAASEPTDTAGADGTAGAGLVGDRAPVAAPLRPGEGVEVTAGTEGQWGHFRAELYRQLLGELGYEVSDPWEAGPNVAYLWMAAGDLDYWTDGRFPSHEVWLDGDSYDGSRVGDHVSVVGEQMPVGNVLGWLISKTFADEHGVFTMDELNSDPAALAAFDAADAVPGDGKADVFSLWGTYGNIAESQAAFSGWDNIAFVRLDDAEMIERAVGAVTADAPVAMFVGTPLALTAMLEPGVDVYWLGVEEFLDDSNPLGHLEGELFSQVTRGHDGVGGYAAISARECPAAASRPDGLCPLGWAANDIAVAARNDFLAANAAAAALLEAVTLSPVDVSQALARQADGSDPAALAAEWIAANRLLVDQWLTAARTVPAEAEPASSGGDVHSQERR